MDDVVLFGGRLLHFEMLGADDARHPVDLVASGGQLDSLSHGGCGMVT